MKLRTLFLYLLGSRQAIREIAASRHAVWIGALFVLSAGFAREYDQEDLLHEPWYLLLPFGASLLTSFLLYVLVSDMVPPKRSGWPGYWTGYRVFLSLYWMTAPLAWLYVIPYERFLDPYEAAQANLWTLGLVATWRVLLMMRVLQVLMNYSLDLSLTVVLLFGSLLAFLGTVSDVISTVGTMGGIQEDSASTQLLSNVSGGVCCLSAVVFPVCAVCMLWARKGFIAVWNESTTAQTATQHGLFWLSLASVLVWAFILPFTQPEHVRAYQVDTAMEQGRVAEALDQMSTFEREAFPRNWVPPSGYKRHLSANATMVSWDVLEALVEKPAAPWVRKAYLRRLGPYHLTRALETEKDVPRIRRILLHLPEWKELLREWENTTPQETQRLREMIMVGTMHSWFGLD